METKKKQEDLEFLPVFEKDFIDEEVPESVEILAAAFVESLKKDGMKVEDTAFGSVERLFAQALDHGEVSETGDSKEDVRDIVIKMEFQIMLKGSGEDDTVTKDDVDQFTRDLFGEVKKEPSLIKEMKTVNIVASVPTNDEKETLKEFHPDDTMPDETVEAPEVSYDEGEFASGIRVRKAALETFEEKLLDPDAYPNPYISTVDRYVAAALLEAMIEIFDSYLEKDEKGPVILLLYETCIYKKLNAILQEELFVFMDADELIVNQDLSQEEMETMRSLEQEFSDYLDEVMAKTKADCIKALKDS